MYKLKDVIASGGKNPKINKALDRYELSKEEKKDIVNEVKSISNSGGGASSGSNIEYLDVSQIEDTSIVQAICMMAIVIDMDYQNGRLILPAAVGGAMANYYKVYKVAVYDDFSINFTTVEGQISVTTLRPIKEFLFEVGLTQEQLDAIPRITKEEFYNLQ